MNYNLKAAGVDLSNEVRGALANGAVGVGQGQPVVHPAGAGADGGEGEVEVPQHGTPGADREAFGAGGEDFDRVKAEVDRVVTGPLLVVPEDERPPARLRHEAYRDGGPDHPSSTMALMTPVSGFV